MLLLACLVAYSGSLAYDLAPLAATLTEPAWLELGTPVRLDSDSHFAIGVTGAVAQPATVRIDYQVLAPNIFCPSGISLPFAARVGLPSGLGAIHLAGRAGSFSGQLAFTGTEGLVLTCGLDTTWRQTVQVDYALLVVSHDNIPALPAGVYIPVRGSVQGSGLFTAHAQGGASLQTIPVRLDLGYQLGRVKLGLNGGARFVSGSSDLFGLAGVDFPSLTGQLADFPNPFYPTDWKVDLDLVGRAKLDTLWSTSLDGSGRSAEYSLGASAGGTVLGIDWHADAGMTLGAALEPGAISRLIYLGNVTPSVVTVAQDIVVDTAGHRVTGTWELDLGRVPVTAYTDSSAAPYTVPTGSSVGLALARDLGPGRLRVSGTWGLGASRSQAAVRWEFGPRLPVYLGVGAEWRPLFWGTRVVRAGPFLGAAAGLEWQAGNFAFNFGAMTSPLLVPDNLPALRASGSALNLQLRAALTFAI